MVDPDAAATAVVVRQLARRLGWALTRDAAICLYTGLVTDTGRFQYANTTPEVFALAAELSAFDLPIAVDVPPAVRAAPLRLPAAGRRRASSGPCSTASCGFVATWVTQADLDRFGVALEETEGLIDLVRRTAEAEVACVLKETPDGIRVSLRSTSDLDVGAIAHALRRRRPPGRGRLHLRPARCAERARPSHRGERAQPR